MNQDLLTGEPIDPDRYELAAGPLYRFEPPDVTRRTFIKILGAGLLITVTGDVALGQPEAPRRGRGGRGGAAAGPVSARLHIGQDGRITVLTGKVEIGQGARTELTQVAAEELRVAVGRIQMAMADTAITPDDGATSGSQTTPRTVPAVRRACAAARQLLVQTASQRWQVAPDALEVRDGRIRHAATGRTLAYAELAQAPEVVQAFAGAPPGNVTVTPVDQWQVMGTSVARPNLKDIVTGRHVYPSDVSRPDMLYGKVLRAPAFGATLASIDLTKAQALPGVVVVRDGEFVGCAARTSHLAGQALKLLEASATWQTKPQPSGKELFAWLKSHAQSSQPPANVAQALETAAKKLGAAYEIAYIQHVPMEPRAAVAEWADGRVTVWTGSQAPTRVHQELSQAFGIGSDRVRVVIPDTGGGFGGKHSGETAVEAARLAKAAGKPVSLCWTRREEFTWAYFRPAGLIEIQGGLDASGKLTAWDFVNINSGGAGVNTPYAIPAASSRFERSDSPLRQGSYRALAATANHFARESFMDELAAAAAADPLAFRLAHLDNDRLRAVLEAAAKKFGWEAARGRKTENVGIGLACGTEKASYVAACVEVAVDRASKTIQVRRVCEAFECGAILNPHNLRQQVEGAIVMGWGGALNEEMLFEDGKILNASLAQYRVPRFRDVPPIEIELLNRPDLTPVGAGETPIVAIAPAIANAVFNAVGLRIRSMPIRLPQSAQA